MRRNILEDTTVNLAGNHIVEGFLIGTAHQVQLFHLGGHILGVVKANFQLLDQTVQLRALKTGFEISFGSGAGLSGFRLGDTIRQGFGNALFVVEHNPDKNLVLGKKVLVDSALTYPGFFSDTGNSNPVNSVGEE